MNTRTQLTVPGPLADAAARRAGADLDGAGLAALARYALARLAGWPHTAAVTAARTTRPPTSTSGDGQ